MYAVRRDKKKKNDIAFIRYDYYFTVTFFSVTQGLSALILLDQIGADYYYYDVFFF